MPKAINLGNGTVLIGLDYFGQVKDLYYHYPGLENHVSEHLTHKIGVYVDDRFFWIDDAGWSVKVFSESDTMASDISAKNESLGTEILFKDVVYNEKNMFIIKPYNLNYMFFTIYGNRGIYFILKPNIFNFRTRNSRSFTS